MKNGIFIAIDILLIVGFVFFSALNASKKDSDNEKNSDTVEYYEGTSEDTLTVDEEYFPDDSGPAQEDPDINQEIDLGFKTDLSAYEKYMNPENRDDYLILANKTNHLGSDFIPENLTAVVNTRQDGRAKQKMVETAAKALEAMVIELNAAGYTDLTVTSAYRAYSYQESLFNSYYKREREKYPDWTDEQVWAHVLTYSAAPGTSEHQTGLCCDMHNMPYGADIAYAQKEEYKWIKENCWKFGFIIRFPEDKVDITGYSFEPWHYRFVGRYHANEIRQRGMCLEEYIEYLRMTGQY